MKNKQIVCHDIQGKKYKVAASDLTFRPAVYGIIIQNGKVLLSKQWDGYDFPGGGIELGETIVEALVREVKEETGLDVSVEKLIACSDSFFKLPFKGNCVQSIHLYFLCTAIGGEPSTEFFDEQEKEYADKPEWIEIDKAERIKFFNEVDSVKLILEAEKLLR